MCSNNDNAVIVIAVYPHTVHTLYKIYLKIFTTTYELMFLLDMFQIELEGWVRTWEDDENEEDL